MAVRAAQHRARRHRGVRDPIEAALSTPRLPFLDAIRSNLLWREWRSLTLACVAGHSIFNPNFVLHYSAVVCGVILLSLVGRLRLKAADVFAVLLTLWTALSLVWAVDLRATGASVTNQIAVLAIFLSVRSAVSNAKQLAIVAVGYLGGCLFAILQLIAQNQTAAIWIPISAARFGIEGVNLNYMAYSLVTGLALTVLLWQILHPGRMRLLLLATVPILCFGLARNGSRGAMIAGILILLWMVAQRFSRSASLLVPVSLLSIAALSIFAGWSDGAFRVLLRGVGHGTGDIAGRLTTWPFARESISSHPFIGIGAGGFRSINPYDIGAHNVPLEVASGLGLIGLALLIAVAYSALITGTRNGESVTRRLLVGAMIAASGPILLSGHWEFSPAAWFGLALFSRIAVLPTNASQIGTKVEVRPSTTPIEPVREKIPTSRPVMAR